MRQDQYGKHLGENDDQTSARSTDYNSSKQYRRNNEKGIRLSGLAKCEEKRDGENGFDEGGEMGVIDNRPHDEIMIAGRK